MTKKTLAHPIPQPQDINTATIASHQKITATL
jgi:hypothetical protein